MRGLDAIILMHGWTAYAFGSSWMDSGGGGGGGLCVCVLRRGRRRGLLDILCISSLVRDEAYPLPRFSGRRQR